MLYGLVRSERQTPGKCALPEKSENPASPAEDDVPGPGEFSKEHEAAFRVLAKPVCFLSIEERERLSALSFDWINPNLELRYAGPKKGRGVYAQKALKKGALLMVSKVHPALHVETLEGGFYDDARDGCLFAKSQKELLRKIMTRITDDLAFGWRLLDLFDQSEDFYPRWELMHSSGCAGDSLRADCAGPGGGRAAGGSSSSSAARTADSRNNLFSGGEQDPSGDGLFAQLVDRVSPIVFPGLPPTSPYYVAKGAADRVLALGETRVLRIVSANVYGGKWDRSSSETEKTRASEALAGGLCRSGSVLHPTMSMLNHSFDEPAAGFLTAQHGEDAYKIPAAMILSRDVGRGEEICSSYTTDRNVAQRQWGIEE